MPRPSAPPIPVPGQVISRYAYNPRLYDHALKDFLAALEAHNLNLDRQGILILAPDGSPLAVHQEQVSFPSAVFTRLHTSLAALQTWTPDHQFQTSIYTTGLLRQSELAGKLWVEIPEAPHLSLLDLGTLPGRLQALDIARISGGVGVKGEDSSGIQNPANRLADHLQQDLRAQGLTLEGKVEVVAELPPNADLLMVQLTAPLENLLRQMHSDSDSQLQSHLIHDLGGPARVDALVNQTTGSTSVLSILVSSSQSVLSMSSAENAARALTQLRSHLGDLDRLLPEVGMNQGIGSTYPVGMILEWGRIGEGRVLANDGLVVAGQLPNGMTVVLANEGEDLELIQALQTQFLHRISLLEPNLD
jgi:D-alanyl-D-alanine carboxypeptidase/D-alanyl-D-alanine-endopeptidase (penicillin-binding protein 4)